MRGEAMPMQARSRYYPRLADAKLLLRLTACKSLSTEARLSALHWHRHLPPSLPCQQPLMHLLPHHFPEKRYLINILLA